MQSVQEAVRGRQGPQSVRLRRSAAGALRPGIDAPHLEPRFASPMARTACGGTRPCCRRGTAESIVSLGEGMTPLVRTRRLGARIGAEHLWVKDEGLNPDRLVQGSRPVLRRLHGRRTRHPEGGDSLGRQRRQRHGRLCRGRRHRSAHLHAARRAAIELHRVQGLRRARHAGGRADQRLRRIVAEAARRPKAGSTSARSRSRTASKARRPWATKSPSRCGWKLPDAIFYPTGGGVGMIGMWKAFDEMETLGWIGNGAAQDDRRAGGRLPAGGARLRAGRTRAASSGRTPTPSPAACACPSRWAIS